jgi:hydroxypyruvate isomerase
MNQPMSRRTALRHLTAGAAAAVSLASLAKTLRAADELPAMKKRINHSVCKWCYPTVELDDLCREGKQMGLASVELLQPADFPTLQKHGLICAMVSNPTTKVGTVDVGGITHGWNRLEYHDALVPVYEAHLRATAAAGYPNLICFSGNREGMPDEQGLENCATGLKRILPLAEKLGVTVCMELLNSRVNHHDYMCDHSAWGVELCGRLPSERFKLLYDIYHMQIMEGDVIATIQQNHQHFAHFHTGGVPGRHEIDDTQELYYPAVMRAIVGTGFKGYVAQEFVPARPDVIASLRQGVQICDV